MFPRRVRQHQHMPSSLTVSMLILLRLVLSIFTHSVTHNHLGSTVLFCSRRHGAMKSNNAWEPAKWALMRCKISTIDIETRLIQDRWMIPTSLLLAPSYLELKCRRFKAELKPTARSSSVFICFLHSTSLGSIRSDLCKNPKSTCQQSSKVVTLPRLVVRRRSAAIALCADEALHPPPAPLKRSFEQLKFSIRTASFSAWIPAHLGVFLPIHAARFPLGKFHLPFADWTF